MENNHRPFQIYFLCGQNRCRSQIAEAFASHFGHESIIVNSAGLAPSPLHPFTVEVMREVGIDITQNSSKKLISKELRSNSIEET
jgi:arsenate reductase